MKRFFFTFNVFPAIFLLCFVVGVSRSTSASTTKISLDGLWSLATDPENVGRTEEWFRSARPEAVDARVPWILQGAFPGYHGVVWYWKTFDIPMQGADSDRVLLRFEQVDYYAEIWLNDKKIGSHEGGEAPFVLDVTEAALIGQANRLAVRVLNPTDVEVDGILFEQTPHRCKKLHFIAGGAYNHGGITGSVSLLRVSDVYVEDLFLDARVQSGEVRFQTTIRNASTHPVDVDLLFSVGEGRNGETIAVVMEKKSVPVGSSIVTHRTSIVNPAMWQLNDPRLYRGTVRVTVAEKSSFHEKTERFGFRDFRFENGYFRLNGERIYLRCSHTCNHYPLGMQFPDDPDLLRRDMINLKMMGFNMVRFIWGAATPEQLDLCDELGLMVYNESYASHAIEDSPFFKQRWNDAFRGVVLRDRNHPSVVIWGLLNEIFNNYQFAHAVESIPMFCELDPSRMLMLNSGRWDRTFGLAGVSGLHHWTNQKTSEPWVAKNVSENVINVLGIVWPAGHVALHPGPNNETAVIRWTAPQAGQLVVDAGFVGLSNPTPATTDVHVLHNGQSLFDAKINLEGAPNEVRYEQSIEVKTGDTLDFAVGTGNNNYGADTTGLKLILQFNDVTYDLVNVYLKTENPDGPWQYGWFAPGGMTEFTLFSPGDKAIGSLSNPDSFVWEDVVHDTHPYQAVPHTPDIIASLRRHGPMNGLPVFLSEYGIGSAVDLVRTVRFFEQKNAAHLEDARFFQGILDRFLSDWNQWKLDGVFERPEDFFRDSITRMASQRTLGISAIRSNPALVGHSVTGAIDHVMTGEGLTTTFRELKPGTVDAMFDAWAPLRWCLFAAPFHIYRGQTVRLEAVLANEDALFPGTWPVRLEVFGPNGTRVFLKELDVTIPEPVPGKEEPFAQSYFDEHVLMDVPEGKYRFTATFLCGAAAAGGETFFYVTDAAAMPNVENEIVLWGTDTGLKSWLTERRIKVRDFSPDRPSVQGEVILAVGTPPVPGGSAVFDDLKKRIDAGAKVVFLCPEVFADGDNRTAYVPLKKKGNLTSVWSWLYLTDHWSRKHRFFDGLPTGGLMDYTYYAELIPHMMFMGQDVPDTAIGGGIKASQDYASGLFLSEYRSGKGSFVLNSLNLRAQLGTHPAAERLLRNMLRVE